jgi:beta-phosphoglucomutase
VRALLFDFNGTLSDDEPLLCELFCGLFAEYGRPLGEGEYYERLAGLSDPDIVRTWLGRDEPQLLDAFLHRYLDRARDGHTVSEAVRTAVRYAVGVAHLAVVSGALRPMVEAVLGGAGLRECFEAIVTAEDVERGKPDPAGYRLALTRLGVEPDDAAAIEDSIDGVTAARAAGVYTVGIVGTASRERLAAADEVVGALDLDVVERLAGQPRRSR